MNKCKICKQETELFFCPNCGKIFEYPAFIADSPQLCKDLDEYVKDLVEKSKLTKNQIHEFVNNGKLSEAVFRKYYEHVAHLQTVCSYPRVSETFDKTGSSLFEIMSGFAEKCKRNECQIAVVGTVKAGKSMFLNAVLGKEVASSYPTPETAALTKFRYSDKGYYVKVTYYTDKEWDVLWRSVMEAKRTLSFRDDKEDFISQYNKLGAENIKKQKLNREPDTFNNLSFENLHKTVEKYTSAKYPEHFFAKEVEVGMAEFNVPKNVVFVDTPGLNDPVSFRSDITKRYIASANVVLLCVKAASAEIKADELNEIGILFSEMRYAKERLYIFGTQYDTQNHFVEYWEKHTKPEFVKYLSGKSYFGTVEKANERIIPISAWYYLLAQRAKNNRDLWKEGGEFEEDLVTMVDKCLGVARRVDPEKRFYESISQIEELTNVQTVSRMILEGPVKEAESIIVNDLKNTYKGICDEIQSAATATMEMRTELVKDSNNDNVYQRIKEVDANIKALNDNHQKNISLINKALAAIEKETVTLINKVKD